MVVVDARWIAKLVRSPAQHVTVIDDQAAEHPPVLGG